MMKNVKVRVKECEKELIFRQIDGKSECLREFSFKSVESECFGSGGKGFYYAYSLVRGKKRDLGGNFVRLM